MDSFWRRLVDSVLREAARARPRPERPVPGRTGRPPKVGGAQPATSRAGVQVVYAPDPDGDPDPGEVVWAWVPYEEDAGQGKDRPVLLVARQHGRLLGVQLSSRSREGDDEWLRLGTGGWDPQGRPSWVRLDRVLSVDPQVVRREGATLDRERFDRVTDRLRRLHGWS